MTTSFTPVEVMPLHPPEAFREGPWWDWRCRSCALHAWASLLAGQLPNAVHYADEGGRTRSVYVEDSDLRGMAVTALRELHGIEV